MKQFVLINFYNVGLCFSVILLIYLFYVRSATDSYCLRKQKETETASEFEKLIPTYYDEVDNVRRIVARLPKPEWNKIQANALKHGFSLLPMTPTDLHISPYMTARDTESLFHQYISTPQIVCPTKTRIGRADDGGWDACIAGPYNITKPCLVYSFGIGPDWSFDNAVAGYGCQDLAFDPSMGKPDEKVKDMLWFYNTGLGRNNTVNAKNWKIRTFRSLLQEHGHENKTIDILKIDVEYAEWEAFLAMFEDGSLRRVKQLAFEFHTKEVELDRVRRNSTSTDYAYYWQILRGLDRLGFKMWQYQTNTFGMYHSRHRDITWPCCGNVYYINTNYLL